MSPSRSARCGAESFFSNAWCGRRRKGLPFDRLFVMVNRQEFTKTANCWGVSNNAKGTNSNRIVILRRH